MKTRNLMTNECKSVMYSSRGLGRKERSYRDKREIKLRLESEKKTILGQWSMLEV